MFKTFHSRPEKWAMCELCMWHLHGALSVWHIYSEKQINNKSISVFYDLDVQSVISRAAASTLPEKALQMQNFELHTTSMESKSAFLHGVK